MLAKSNEEINDSTFRAWETAMNVFSRRACNHFVLTYSTSLETYFINTFDHFMHVHSAKNTTPVVSVLGQEGISADFLHSSAFRALLPLRTANHRMQTLFEALNFFSIFHFLLDWESIYAREAQLSLRRLSSLLSVSSADCFTDTEQEDYNKERNWDKCLEMEGKALAFAEHHFLQTFEKHLSRTFEEIFPEGSSNPIFTCVTNSGVDCRIPSSLAGKVCIKLLSNGLSEEAQYIRLALPKY